MGFDAEKATAATVEWIRQWFEKNGCTGWYFSMSPCRLPVYKACCGILPFTDAHSILGTHTPHYRCTLQNSAVTPEFCG